MHLPMIWYVLLGTTGSKFLKTAEGGSFSFHGRWSWFILPTQYGDLMLVKYHYLTRTRLEPTSDLGRAVLGNCCCGCWLALSLIVQRFLWVNFQIHSTIVMSGKCSVNQPHWHLIIVCQFLSCPTCHIEYTTLTEVMWTPCNEFPRLSMPIRIQSQIAVDCKSVH